MALDKSPSSKTSLGRLLAILRLWQPSVFRLLKFYAAFAAMNTIYKLMSIRARYGKAQTCFKHLKGEKIDYLGKRISKNMHRVHDYVTEMVLKHPTSPLVKLPGPGVELVCNTPESVEWMLKTEFKNCTKGNPKKDFMYHLLREFLGEGIFTLRHGKQQELLEENDKWYSSRKTASLLFTKSAMMSNMQETFAEKAINFRNVLSAAAEKGEAVDMQALFFSFTMDSIQKLFFGKEVNTVEGGSDPYATAFDEAHRNMLLLIYRSILVNILTIMVLPWPFGTLSVLENGKGTIALELYLRLSEDHRRFKENVAFLNKITGDFIKEIRNDPNMHKRKDMIANFLNSKSTCNMSDESLTSVVLNLTIAGRDTTACTLSWMFYMLTQNPEVQARLCEEIDQKLEGKVPTLEDLHPDNMPYLNGVLYETLRLYPAVPNDEKFTTCDLKYLDGTVIPAGTKLIFVPYAMGRNPEIHKDPLKVDPTRWIPFEPPSLYTFPVFQAGPRFCLGKDMAQFETKLLASMLLQQFTFTMEKSEAEKITYSMAITMSLCNSKEQDSHNLWITPHKRNTCV